MERKPSLSIILSTTNIYLMLSPKLYFRFDLTLYIDHVLIYLNNIFSNLQSSEFFLFAFIFVVFCYDLYLSIYACMYIYVYMCTYISI